MSGFICSSTPVHHCCTTYLVVSDDGMLQCHAGRVVRCAGQAATTHRWNLDVWQHMAAFVSDVLKKAALSC